MTAPSSTLTPKHQQLVRDGLQQCQEWHEYLEKLESLGIDTAKWREDHASFDHLFRTVAQHWMPGEYQ